MTDNQFNNIKVGDQIKVGSKKNSGSLGCILGSKVYKIYGDKIELLNLWMVEKEDFLLSHKRNGDIIFVSDNKNFSPWKGVWPNDPIDEEILQYEEWDEK